MNKVFLSHSSNDKKYVQYIAEQFGRDYCVYDSMCFEAGMKNIDEIFREMDNTSIFVVFLSDSALNSEWVQKELSIADERLNHDSKKLSQIFPIIIDPVIDHADSRIPDFLKKGFTSYNLRVIASNKVAYRKIKAQQIKYLLDNRLCTVDDLDCFYGREQEIANFKKRFDTGDGFNCIIASGLTRIGRKSYLLHALKKSRIIEDYYAPPTISLRNMSTIEDLIVKLSEIGFGTYSLENVTTLPDMDAKIDALVKSLETVQNYKEQVTIYDDGVLISRSGDIAYWFEKALRRIRKEVTLLIASRFRLNFSALRNNPHIFFQELSTLPYNEWNGLMRVYGKTLGLELTSDDRSYFKDILTGYPPQVRYCVELVKDTSIEEVKKKPHILVETFSSKILEMLETIIPTENQTDAYGLLSFMSAYGIVPTELLHSVLELSKGYQNAFTYLKNATICRYLGVSNEYIEVNPVISDYIQRNRIELPKDIKELLSSRLSDFNGRIMSENATTSEDYENIKYYLKSNIIEGKDIPERFMYSSVYLSSIYELYNRQKYLQVISIVEKLKDSRAFFRYDLPAQIRIQEFYCRALARQTDQRFYEEVEFFKNDATKNLVEYEFLRGFMFRHKSEYGKALDRYKRVLEMQPHHRSAMREIVIVYRGLYDYESAYEYAKSNYINEPENPFHIQPFFEILVRKSAKNGTSEENEYIQQMLSTITRLHSTKPITTYYEMHAQHATYIENDSQRALGLLEEGKIKFPDSSYVVRTLFDCSEYFDNLNKMSESLQALEKMSEDNKSIKTALKIRTALFYAHQRKPKDFISNYINGIDAFDSVAKERLQKKVDAIFAHSK